MSYALIPGEFSFKHTLTVPTFHRTRNAAHLLRHLLQNPRSACLGAMFLPKSVTDFDVCELLSKLDFVYDKRINHLAEWSKLFWMKQKQSEFLVDFQTVWGIKSLNISFPLEMKNTLAAACTVGLESETNRQYLCSLPVSSKEKFERYRHKAGQWHVGEYSEWICVSLNWLTKSCQCQQSIDVLLPIPWNRTSECQIQESG